jgi:hypothetical protein
VVGRAPRSSFGIEVAIRSNLSPEFRGREVFTCASGYEKVSGGWSQIAAKVRTTLFIITYYIKETSRELCLMPKQ